MVPESDEAGKRRLDATANGDPTEVVPESDEAGDQNHLRVMEMHLIGFLEQQLRTAELLLDGV